MFAALLIVAAAAPDDFVAVGPGEARPMGRVIAIAADGRATIATATGEVEVADVVSVRRAGAPLPPLPRGPVLIATTGDRVPLRKSEAGLLAGDDQTLRLRPAFTDAEWDVPVAYAALVWMVKPTADTPLDPARESWLPANRNRDWIRLRNGDTASGSFGGFHPEGGLRLKPETGDERLVPLDRIAAVAFNPTLARGRKVKGPFAQLVLVDGTRIGLTQFSADATRVVGKALFGPMVEVTWDRVVSLDVMQGKGVNLADLKPAKAEQVAFLGTTWAWTANRSVGGGALRVGESTFDRGLGTAPRTTLTYDLGGKYRRFEATVGLDPASGPRGRAEVRVLVDGKEVPRPELRSLAASTAVNLAVNLDGAKELTLIVDFAGDTPAAVNWGDPRLLKP